MIRLVLLTLLLITSISSNAYDFEVDGLYYSFNSYNESNLFVTYGDTQYQGDVVIPNQVLYNGKNYQVTSISDYAFEECRGLTSVTIPSCVTSIGSRAFYYCSNLASINIPNSVTSIGYDAFAGTAWYNNQPDGLIYAGKCAYKYKGAVPANTSVSIKEGTLAIAEDAFYLCSNLTSITIPNSVTSIGITAFDSCSSLTSINIPNSVTNIGKGAFAGCSSLTSIAISNSVTCIEWSTFRNCNSLTSITIPNSVTSIENYAFQGCSGLTSIYSEIENPFTIDNSVFDGIPSSAQLIVPKGTKDKYQTTAGWNHITNIVEVGGVGYAFEADGINYRISEDNTVCVTYKKAGYSGDVVIPSSVVYQRNTYRVTSIESAFYGCYGLTSITIPSSVTSIGTFAFCESGLTSITIPNSVTSIGFEAFKACDLTSVTIPSSVTFIGPDAFSECYCLATVVSEIEDPFEFAYDAFWGIYTKATLIVPPGTKSAYQSKAGWNLFTNIIEAGGEEEPDLPGQIHISDIYYKVTESGEAEVMSVEKEKKCVSIPSTISHNNSSYKVTSIAKEVFQDCEHLAAVIWEPEIQFYANVNNPNFLLYVKDEKYASRTVKNVVVNNVAESIELTDASGGNDFYCPRAFTAKKISYSHHYNMETGLGDSKGWETIVLPFDVQKCTHATKGEIETFTTWTMNSNKKPFWLFELTADGYRDVAGIKANTPYIISMPNNQQYEQQYQIPGIVTFSASDVEVQKSDNLKPGSYQGRSLVPNYTNKSDENYLALNVSNNYVTNPGKDISGSKFVRGLRTVHPFEAYMITTDNTRSIDVMEGMTTTIRGIQMVKDGASVIKVYDTRGVLMKTATSIDDVRNGLKSGVYIVNGKKMVIK